MKVSKQSKYIRCLFLSWFIIFLFAGSLQADDQTTLDRLEKIIQQQQLQIEELQKQINAIRAESEKKPEEAKTKEPAKFVNSDNEKIKVTLYGQVNRGVLFVDDGNDKIFYPVDNDNSSTRIGFLGSAKASDALDIGSKIEVQFESNSSSEVSQLNKRGVGDNNFTKRHLDLFLNSKQYGKLSIGFGSTASDTTSETDLSGTTVVAYSSVSDMAGGQFFYNGRTNAYSTTKIGNVFSNMDGLSRDDRIRYDSPSFLNFSASTSYIADGGVDVALRYSTKLESVKLVAAASYANPGSTSNKTDYQTSASLSALHDSGISLTLAGGFREYKAYTDGDGQFFYTKLGYQSDFFTIGKTALSIDFGIFKDVAGNSDEATTYGAHFVQNLKNWGTEYYLGYRLYKLDRNNTDFEDINAFLSGFRVKF